MVRAAQIEGAGRSPPHLVLSSNLFERKALNHQTAKSLANLSSAPELKLLLFLWLCQAARDVEGQPQRRTIDARSIEAMGLLSGLIRLLSLVGNGPSNNLFFCDNDDMPIFADLGQQGGGGGTHLLYWYSVQRGALPPPHFGEE